MSKEIIAVVGLCGAGKSVVCEYIEQKGYQKVYFGGFTMEELKRRGLEINPENEKWVREDLRNIHGMAAYAVLAEPAISAILRQSGNVLIDGLYSFSEYKFLKEKYGEQLHVVAVFAPPKLRYKRLTERVHRPLSEVEARSRDYAEIDNIEKGGPIAMADVTLVNDKDTNFLFDQIHKMSF